jgi:hypothetical protein
MRSKVKQIAEGLKMNFIVRSLKEIRIYQQRIVFIECAQVAWDGD